MEEEKKYEVVSVMLIVVPGEVNTPRDPVTQSISMIGFEYPCKIVLEASFRISPHFLNMGMEDAFGVHIHPCLIAIQEKVDAMLKDGSMMRKVVESIELNKS